MKERLKHIGSYIFIDWEKAIFFDSIVHINSHRFHPAISHCSHLLLKCRVATNISHWLKVQSRWLKNYTFAKNCILVSFWIFEYCFYHSFTLCYCAVFLLFGCWIFSIPSGCQTVWIQTRPDISSGLIWVRTVCNGYQQT